VCLGGDEVEGAERLLSEEGGLPLEDLDHHDAQAPDVHLGREWWRRVCVERGNGARIPSALIARLREQAHGCESHRYLQHATRAEQGVGSERSKGLLFLAARN
jgi:hypothetical protein